MREAIGSTWILQLVIVFMLIFVSFLALSINYTKAFKMKNEILSMLEKYEGAKEGEKGSISIINNYLRYNNYQTTKNCEVGEYGMPSLDTPTLELVEEGNKGKDFYYCIGKISTKNQKYSKRAKYEAKIFFHFNLPVIGDLFTFTVSGMTIDINIPSDNLIPKI